jgi:hypothetical protein
MFDPNPAFLLVQKLKSAHRGFTLGVKAEMKKIKFNLPQLLITAELYGLVLAPRLKIWDPYLQPLGTMLQHLLIIS